MGTENDRISDSLQSRDDGYLMNCYLLRNIKKSQIPALLSKRCDSIIETKWFWIASSLRICDVNPFNYNCVNFNLYEGINHEAASHGVLDPKMGTSRKNQKCTTCGKQVQDCIGHFGYVDLNLPVFHVGYFRSIITILQSICKTCARVLLKPEERMKYSEILKQPNINYLKKKQLRKQIVELCVKKSVCPFCNATNGLVGENASAGGHCRHLPASILWEHFLQWVSVLKGLKG
ncbi:DNA-directed RNA polymerase III subunit RPC1 [Araneus ventricosus]|uniref:DNA-directed RNA polymerase n=1 Tax=Araneus ventricosus TaxID=182803 RepID=A0A4Y2SIZ0_ARAVE|nr:DNA-directed RNA polymerase III subunit RPC1 [Araneus ventricosus]